MSLLDRYLSAEFEQVYAASGLSRGLETLDKLLGGGTEGTLVELAITCLWMVSKIHEPYTTMLQHGEIIPYLRDYGVAGYGVSATAYRASKEKLSAKVGTQACAVLYCLLLTCSDVLLLVHVHQQVCLSLDFLI